MTQITVMTRDGCEHVLNGEHGVSVMETIRGSGIDDIPALCGGCMSCATCHVYVDERDLSLLPAQSEEELDLLDGLLQRTERSRLSCQIKCTPDLTAFRLEIAPEE